MYSMFTERKRAKIAERKARSKRKLFGTSNRKEKEDRVRRVYGKNTAALAAGFHTRAMAWCSTQTAKKPIPNAPHPSMVKFRPPRKTYLELGDRTISVAPDSLTPRAAYHGGGLLNIDKSKQLPARPLTVLPRLKQPMYENQRYFMRTRDPSKEISGHMRYRYQSDKQRLQELLDYEPKPEGPLPYGPGGRPTHSLSRGSGFVKPDPSRWRSSVPGGWALMKSGSSIDPKTSSMTGVKYKPGLMANEFYDGPSGSANDMPCINGVRPGKSSLLRKRLVRAEKGGTFMGLTSPHSSHRSNRKSPATRSRILSVGSDVSAGGSAIDYSDSAFLDTSDDFTAGKTYSNTMRQCFSP